ncbi:MULTISPECIES: isoaspartyl peptidase/L-asparaginase [Pseudoalteromonas]|mgnify:CR=1 FL=1|uniref:Isoaspartyl peptidase n=2 Tax=Pseudoalteromonas TaxID=53246 RepID=A0AAC9UIW1_9GAMM|nr:MULTISPECIES: isoaspartyl peptidase/L-asparaginase [Pseudoalteromonas]ASM53576.1 beta-aspartyl-peptidase (threonine type) [Pseudoalteromonas nigrifaciens]MBB1369922.1 isoaspartyl peptidase/L-asparaginase [Pseudoalteromonas sp. SR45-4]MBB1404154.1 isoaspartyl peptidase/L-asparaginase [Pseudoalteromonas sp. SG44-5]MBE0421068.1 isoaspartyl peptidase/L-asparaginase [Pseudoalteromonas nigrifaciens]MBH0094090.1 isoaspartyl peptidase/L-asparaginase [Pseudoalteromonas sp. SCQQ13]|tara:strand:- start:4834 stop:5868 length:1035 start_codon:yes stop_codon:yes gene_type:complete
MKKSLLMALIATSFISVSNNALSAEVPFAIAIHGGAGTIEKSKFTPKEEQAYRAKLTQAVEAGYKVLEQGGESLDAITAAIQVMEQSTYFNAGRGAVYTYDGSHELDASIMDGRNRQAGAVAGVKHVESPINLARLVMDNSVHVMLSGQGAEEFAKEQGIPLIENNLFDTEHRYKALLKAKQKLDKAKATSKDYQAAHKALPNNYKMGTVGAVALDKNGNLAAGTSTGGMTAKRYGRIGDAPVIGAGTFAENESCAVSATGHGEYFIRYNVASDICARVKYQGKTITQAGDEVINGVLAPIGGTGGVIIVDTKGNISLPFNTSGMYRASKSNTQATYVGIFKGE